jgi:hypothetical protein
MGEEGGKAHRCADERFLPFLPKDRLTPKTLHVQHIQIELPLYSRLKQTIHTKNSTLSYYAEEVIHLGTTLVIT